MKHRTVGAPEAAIKRARRLRKGMSLPEVLLWRELRLRPGGYKFRRQFPQTGYVLDFACLEARLGIEVDGEAHGRGDNPARDRLRDQRLEAAGFTMLRVPAREVLSNMEGVLGLVISRCAAERPLHHASHGPPPRSGEDLE